MFTLLIAALLHPVHETVAEIEWNARTSRLEVALRIDVLDEQWLQKNHGKNRGVSQWALPYLRRNFRVTERPEKNEPDQTNYRWIGRKPEGSHVWWYFEIQPPGNRQPTWIEQRVLFDREQNYTHRILILENDRRLSLDLDVQRPKANLDEAQHARAPTPPADR